MIERVTARWRQYRGAGRGWRNAGLVVGACSVVGAATALQASCAQTPTAVPVQSFQRPQDVDFVCMQVLDANGHAIVPAIPQPQAQCAPVPVNVDGTTLPYHLYALVTQTTAGAVAVVDLTGGYVVDDDPGTPGINFLPVGTLPSDIASSPDGVMSFVGSATPNAPAIYALPSSVILGDSQGGPPDGGKALIPALTTWPACSLPQAPGAIAVVPTSRPSSAASVDDAGVGAGAGEGGAAAAGPGYVVVAVLPGDTSHPAQVATFDPLPFLRGAGALVPGIDPNGPSIAPGSLDPCPRIQNIELATPAADATWSAGPAWDDGVKYVDGGVDAEIPTTGVSCVATDAGSGALFHGAVPSPRAGAAVVDTGGTHPILYVADTQLPLIHAIDLFDPSAPTELTPYLATSIASPTRLVSVGKIAVSPTTRDFKRFLYAIDQTQGSIMVYDVTDPANGPHVPLTRPHPELAPLEPPDRVSFNAPVAALSFAVHDWPLTQQVVAGTSSGAAEEQLLTAQTGLLCNPNPTVDPSLSQITNNGGFTPDQGPFSDPGAFYRQNSGNQQVLLGPYRLRGVFAFVTLSNGNVVTLDVDDWDAPCRRPDPMASPGQQGVGGSSPIFSVGAAALVEGPLSSIAPAEPSDDGRTGDPYHAPISFQTYDTNTPVSLEWFFPVSAPHRLRSNFTLRNDPTNGQHAPYLLATPELYSSGAPLATQGDQGVANPSLVPTDTHFVDPSLQSNPTVADPSARIPSTTLPTAPGSDGFITDGGLDATTTSVGDAAVASIALGQSTPGASPTVRFAWEDPTTQLDQDWVVTYEGQLPGFYDTNSNPLVVANVVASDGGAAYQTVSLASQDAYFCRKGVEDVATGSQRADAVNAELAKDGLPTIPVYDKRVGDYVQLTDNIRDPSDGYWQLPNACWSEPNAPTIAISQRANLCSSVFGSTLDPSNPSTARDFPILEAYDDHLVIGRFGYPSGVADGGVDANPRQIVSSDPSNVPFLMLMQCCFANQVHFNVRTGGEWSAVGSSVGLLNHVAATGSDNRCESTCDARNALLNGRSPPVPRPATQSTSVAACPSPFVPSIDRDSPLALRNPMFSFFIWNGQDTTNACADREPIRDMAWKFSTRGQLAPLTLDLASTTTSLSPQTMKFIDSLGQVAVVDGESQGLILIDLDTFTEPHTPYF